MIFSKALDLAHAITALLIREGDFAVDATAGNGKDTVFLARHVGPDGHVFAFDIQEVALAQTRRLLQQENLLDRVTLFHKGHEQMSDCVPEKIAVVMFNLGYLPGGDHSIVTTPGTTMRGIKEALKLLQRGGIISIVVYTGHPGGAAEKNMLWDFCSRLDQHLYGVIHHNFINQAHSPPELITIQRL